jgi:hypothetical protein
LRLAFSIFESVNANLAKNAKSTARVTLAALLNSLTVMEKGNRCNSDCQADDSIAPCTHGRVDVACHVEDFKRGIAK